MKMKIWNRIVAAGLAVCMMIPALTGCGPSGIQADASGNKQNTKKE